MRSTAVATNPLHALPVRVDVVAVDAAALGAADLVDLAVRTGDRLGDDVGFALGGRF